MNNDYVMTILSIKQQMDAICAYRQGSLKGSWVIVNPLISDYFNMLDWDQIPIYKDYVL